MRKTDSQQQKYTKPTSPSFWLVKTISLFILFVFVCLFLSSHGWISMDWCSWTAIGMWIIMKTYDDRDQQRFDCFRVGRTQQVGWAEQWEPDQSSSLFISILKRSSDDKDSFQKRYFLCSIPSTTMRPATTTPPIRSKSTIEKQKQHF